MSRQEFSRQDRVRKAIIREVSDIIANEVKLPELQDHIISITDCELSNDMQHAKVFISILADEAKQQELLSLLVEWQPKIRQVLGQRIRLRFTPDIHLKLDDSLERGSRVTQLLDQIARGEV